MWVLEYSIYGSYESLLVCTPNTIFAMFHSFHAMIVYIESNIGGIIYYYNVCYIKYI